MIRIYCKIMTKSNTHIKVLMMSKIVRAHVRLSVNSVRNFMINLSLPQVIILIYQVTCIGDLSK